MKGNSRKIIALLLALAMILAFSACSKNQKQETTTGDDNTNAVADNGTENNVGETGESDSGDAQGEDEIDPYPAFDFGGRTIKVGIWWDYYYTSEHTDIKDDPGLSNVETAQLKLDNVRRIEDKYNCKIVFVNLGWEGIIESINSSIAAGTPECDIYLTDLQFGIPAVVNGLAQKLEDFVPEYTDLFGEQKVIKPLKTEMTDGTYLFTEQGLPQSGIYLGYNWTMMEELGLEDPQELFKKGQWTTEKFREYAIKGTRDTNNDSTVDVYGFGGVFTDLINGLLMNNNGSIAAGKEEGLSSKPTVEVLELINQLYNVDKSARPWNAEDWNDNLLAWSDGKVMMWTAQAWALKQEADAAIKEGAELPFEYRIVPYPIGPSGDKNIYSPVLGNWYIIPVGVKEPGKVFQVFEEFLNWHKGDTALRDDPTWFESCFQRIEDVEMAYECGKNLKLDIWGSLPGFDFGENLWWPIVVDKTSTVSQAVEATKPVLQDALNAFFK
ncbi:ABC transporter substrate-binding protein [Pseudoclostridium thermosuccinogenes]|uniref:ABC transporter substrate-binding protein n=1 Tax=Clostridium thermosuccinogenes TaxID=84032 RepID=UPI002FDAEBB8